MASANPDMMAQSRSSASGTKPDMEVLANGDIIYRIGFSQIHCDFFKDRQVLLKEGKDLSECDHIFNVEELKPKKEDRPVVITTQCMRQMNIRSDPYWITLELDENRNVQYGGLRSRCSCQAGVTGKIHSLSKSSIHYCT